MTRRSSVGNAVLLDSNALLWLTDRGQGRLGPKTVDLISGAEAVYFSAASVWELSIKAAKGRVVLPDQFVAGLRTFNLLELPVTGLHGEAIRTVELPHADPFDRLIVAQSIQEDLVLVTSDRKLLDTAPCKVHDALR